MTTKFQCLSLRFTIKRLTLAVENSGFKLQELDAGLSDRVRRPIRVPRGAVGGSQIAQIHNVSEKNFRERADLQKLIRKTPIFD